METFTLSREELHRPGLLKAAGPGRITNRQIAEALRLASGRCNACGGASRRAKPKNDWDLR